MYLSGVGDHFQVLKCLKEHVHCTVLRTFMTKHTEHAIADIVVILQKRLPLQEGRTQKTDKQECSHTQGKLTCSQHTCNNFGTYAYMYYIYTYRRAIFHIFLVHNQNTSNASNAGPFTRL